MQRPIDKLYLNGLTLPYRPFYRRYPFTSPVSIRSADDRGCVDLDVGFFCNRVPKAANSTVTTNLARLAFGEDVPSKLAKKRFTTPGRLTARQIDAFDQLFKFTVVRNPYTRTLSAYLDKIERRAERAGKDTSFKSFLLELKQGALHSNAHWAPQRDLMLIPIGDFDVIGKVETLEQDLLRIKQTLQPDQAHPMTSFRNNATGANQKLQTYYDNDCIDLVAEMYHGDFVAFDYPLTFPA